jgi:ribonuclease Z
MKANYFEDDKVVVRTIPLKPVYQWFLFEEKIDKRKLNTECSSNYEIDKCYFQNIKNDVT